MMDGKIVLLAAVIIVLIHSAKSTETSGPSEDPDKLLVDRLCRSKKVHLTTMAQYNSLFKPPSSSELLNTCPDNLKSIITHFQPATKLASEDACSMETVQAFKDYYVAFIMDKSKKAPRWWKQFVVAYGMQLSNLCKENALKVLTSTEALLREEDVARLGDWVSDTSPLRPILESMNEPGTFVLPTDFIALASRNASFVPEKMYIQSKETKSLKLYKEVCQKRFQPVYERLMMPLAVLSGIGFYYMKEELLVEYENRENSAVHDKWTNILFVCEALKLVEPVEYLVSNGDGDDKDNDDEVAPLFGPLEKDDMELSSRYDEQPEPRSKPTNPKRKWWQLCWWCSKKKSVEMNDDGVIKLLTKEEAHAINQKYEELQRVQSLGYETDDASDVIEQFAPEFTKIQMKDLVLDKSDKKLVKTVKKFKRSKSKMRKVKGRLQRKALITLRRELKAGKVNVLASGAVVEKWESLKSKSRGEDVSKSIVRITEKMADQSIAHEKKWSKTKIIVFITVLILALAVLAVVFYVTGGAAALAIAFGVGLAHGIGRR